MLVNTLISSSPSRLSSAREEKRTSAPGRTALVRVGWQHARTRFLLSYDFPLSIRIYLFFYSFYEIFLRFLRNRSQHVTHENTKLRLLSMNNFFEIIFSEKRRGFLFFPFLFFLSLEGDKILFISFAYFLEKLSPMMIFCNLERGFHEFVEVLLSGRVHSSDEAEVDASSARCLYLVT